MKKFLIILGISSCIGLLSLTIAPRPVQSIGVEHTLAYFKTQARLFAKTTADLEKQIGNIKRNAPLTIVSAKEALKNCRLQYKNIEFFLNYFFSSIAIVYNAPPVAEVEEPFMEYSEATGLQVIAQLLFSPDPSAQKKELLQQASLIRSSAEDLNSLLYNLPIDDKQILESVRLELISVMTLGISGFDAQELKTGIREAKQTLTTIKFILSPYLADKSKEADSVGYYIDRALKLLTDNNNFISFDRLHFLTNAALPLQQHLNLFIKQKGLELNTTTALNYNAENIFSADAINVNNRLNVVPGIAALGRKLFFEKALSGNNSRNCATCHQPGKYLTDGLSKSRTLDELSSVQRNAPTLFYSAFQYSQFWDGRVKNLEEQVMTVLKNPIEMNGDYKIIVQRLQADKSYAEDFAKAFPLEKKDSAITIGNIALSIAAFLKTLSPFDSPFDRYMQGNKSALNQQQIKGFNLFMGKALCGTCHVAPLFNGLTPPRYDRTSLEVLGTTGNVNFKAPALDADSGRYVTYPLPFYMGAFKTPGLRDVAKTAPYMHNGAFPDLETVLEFYNKGGGQGLGLKVPDQTLPSTPLKLDSMEIRNIISFLNALTDPPASNKLF
jgi:cytochrome c peroxidase